MNTKDARIVARMATGLGAVLMVALCVAYAVSPEQAAMPAQPLDAIAAMAGAVQGARTMKLVSALGIPADMLLASGAALLAFSAQGEGRAIEALGWLLLGFSSFAFFFIDTMVGLVLPSLAAADAPQAFLAAKTVFDQLFIAGTIAVGGSAIILAAGMVGGRSYPVWIAALMFVAGLVAAGAGAAAFLGVNAPKPMGLAIAAAGVLTCMAMAQRPKAA